MTAILKERPAALGEAAGITVLPNAQGTMLGADIVGFDFDALLPEQVAAVRAAWIRHGVVRFRGTQITDEQHMRFTALLGEFVKHPRQLKGEEGAHDRYEEILIIGNGKRDGKVVGTMANNEAQWHTDTYIYDRPPAAALLRAMQLPSSGGDTYWADMYAVYQALPVAVRKVIEGRLIQLDIVYDGSNRVRVGQQEPDSDDIRLWAGIRHPIVRTHGESGRNCVYIGSEKRSNWIVGLPLDESNAILAEIMDHVRNPAHQWMQVWQPHDMVMWDNRCTMHRRNGWSAEETRIMHRTTTRGERPHYVC
ncbi:MULTISPECIES: TauD/TfdA dioxygenase family protein [unclassified Sphingomonas]|uniref:TauD/TfdA dioxygenase family protein n=1 Tax=unclassified Sphingomonas TaxID=196159 RepID=UPI000AE50B68|nr:MULTISPECIES: TauD/TfdA family dioxygenase [unclassified Sphingomonas]